MRLMALGAFWQLRKSLHLSLALVGSLNAPFGAWCFLTFQVGLPVRLFRYVLMRLMVLGAFRLLP